MTDIDGKNIIGEEGESIDLEYLWRWSNRMAQGQEMFPSVQFQLGNLTEIPARSSGKIKNFTVRISVSVWSTITFWNVQVNGITVGSIEVPALTTGEFTLPDVIEFAKDDLLRFQCVETAGAPEFHSVVEMLADLEFEPI